MRRRSSSRCATRETRSSTRPCRRQWPVARTGDEAEPLEAAERSTPPSSASAAARRSSRCRCGLTTPRPTSSCGLAVGGVDGRRFGRGIARGRTASIGPSVASDAVSAAASGTIWPRSPAVGRPGPAAASGTTSAADRGLSAGQAEGRLDVLHRVGDLVGADLRADLGRRGAELPKSLAELLAHLGQPLGAEQHDQDRQDDQQMHGLMMLSSTVATSAGLCSGHARPRQQSTHPTRDRQTWPGAPSAASGRGLSKRARGSGHVGPLSRGIPCKTAWTSGPAEVSAAACGRLDALCYSRFVIGFAGVLRVQRKSAPGV